MKNNNEKEIENSDYNEYKKIPVKKSMQSNKYKVNFSLSKAVTQKIQYIQSKEGLSIRDYSKIPELAIDLLYDIKYLLDINEIIDKKSSDILKLLNVDTKKLP